MILTDQLAPNGTAIFYDRDLPQAALVSTVTSSSIEIVQPLPAGGPLTMITVRLVTALTRKRRASSRSEGSLSPDASSPEVIRARTASAIRRLGSWPSAGSRFTPLTLQLV